MHYNGTLYWITGLSGAGKTTIGNQLYYTLRKKKNNVILLDGDILKKMFGEGNKISYTLEARKERAGRYAKLCKMLTDQGMIVICCTIAMFEDIREWNRKNIPNYIEVFLDVPMKILIERDQKGMYSEYKKGEFKNLAGLDLTVEFPRNPDIIINNDGSLTVNSCVQKIIEYKVPKDSLFKRDTKYWNKFYKNKPEINYPSLFATYVEKHLISGKSIIELGCGNGRDSVFFALKGLNVIAIDASDLVISELNEKYKDEKKLNFICDDFVRSETLFMRQYDYCYSRFSIHAINETQEDELLNNVILALKQDGLFFIEVRSVLDELFGKGESLGKNEYIYNGHYRRFIERAVLEEKLKKVGFKILYSAEERDFAPFEGKNPIVIRLICQK